MSANTSSGSVATRPTLVRDPSAELPTISFGAERFDGHPADRIALPLSDHQLEVSAHIRDRSRRSAARTYGMTERSLIELQRNVTATLDGARPVLGDPEELRERAAAHGDRETPEARRDSALWMLSKLEQLALIGVYSISDVREDDGYSEARDCYFRSGHENDLGPRLCNYADELFRQARRRHEDQLEPNLTVLEKAQRARKAELTAARIEVLAVAYDIVHSVTPENLPWRDQRADAHLRWLHSQMSALATLNAGRLRGAAAAPWGGAQC